MRNATEIRERITELHEANEALVTAARDANEERLSDEATKTFDKNEAEITKLNGDLRRAESHEQRQAHLSERREQPIRPEVPAEQPEERGTRVEAGESREGKAPWKAFGEYAYAVRFNPSDPRLVEQRELSMGTDASGGFALPDQFRDDLLQYGEDDALIEPRATVIPAGSPPDAKITIPTLDQTSEGSNVYGGVEVDWIAEGADKPETDAALGSVELEPHEVAGTLVISDKLLRNWQAADPLIRRLFSGAIMAAKETAYLTGDGTGKPDGMAHANNTSLIEINRETADEVSFADVATMYSRILRRGTNPVWIYNPGVLPQLVNMKASTDGPLIWLPSAREGAPSTLFGLPAFAHEAMALPGAAGDIMLVDLSYYLIKQGSGPFVAASEHVLFRSNKTVFKAFTNVDGAPWTTAPLTISGQTYSPFVSLDVPAA